MQKDTTNSQLPRQKTSMHSICYPASIFFVVSNQVTNNISFQIVLGSNTSWCNVWPTAALISFLGSLHQRRWVHGLQRDLRWEAQQVRTANGQNILKIGKKSLNFWKLMANGDWIWKEHSGEKDGKAPNNEMNEKWWQVIRIDQGSAMGGNLGRGTRSAIYVQVPYILPYVVPYIVPYVVPYCAIYCAIYCHIFWHILQHISIYPHISSGPIYRAINVHLSCNDIVLLQGESWMS